MVLVCASSLINTERGETLSLAPLAPHSSPPTGQPMPSVTITPHRHLSPAQRAAANALIADITAADASAPPMSLDELPAVSPHPLLFLAHTRNELIGLATAPPGRNIEATIAVAPFARRQGIGRQLLTAIQSELRRPLDPERAPRRRSESSRRASFPGGRGRRMGRVRVPPLAFCPRTAAQPTANSGNDSPTGHTGGRICPDQDPDAGLRAPG